MLHRSENQFVYPNPKRSKLIFFTPLPDGKAGFRFGVNELNQITILILDAEIIKTNQ